MFEKEANKWVENNLHSTEEDYIKAFKDGAEFGYNKAFVEADKNLKAIVTDFNKAKELIEELKEENCELLGIIQGKDKVIQELKKKTHN